jgi:NifU-like protein involved in Fe-S cluster formation
MAAASMLTEKLQSRTIRDTQALTEQDVYTMLGVTVGVGREKCALLSYRALQELLQRSELADEG